MVDTSNSVGDSSIDLDRGTVLAVVFRSRPSRRRPHRARVRSSRHWPSSFRRNNMSPWQTVLTRWLRESPAT